EAESVEAVDRGVVRPHLHTEREEVASVGVWRRRLIEGDAVDQPVVMPRRVGQVMTEERPAEHRKLQMAKLPKSQTRTITREPCVSFGTLAIEPFGHFATSR